jgi:hypothetical protein
MARIKVTYEMAASSWAIRKKLCELDDVELMAFDVETSGLYAQAQRKEAAKLLEADMSPENHKLASVVANNSGLSFPSLTQTTHFIFGLAQDHSVVLVADTQHKEMQIWNWLCMFNGTLVIHNTLFDLKIMYHRIGKFPKHFEDTALMIKTLINNANNWQAKVGLKDVMGSHYPAAWALFDQYEPENLKNPKFLEYAAIDGAATYFLYQLLLEEFTPDATHS